MGWGRHPTPGGGCCTPLPPALVDLVSQGQGCPVLGRTSRLEGGGAEVDLGTPQGTGSGLLKDALRPSTEAVKLLTGPITEQVSLR